MSKAARRIKPSEAVGRIKTRNFRTFKEVLDRAVEMKNNAGDSWSFGCTVEILNYARKYKGGNTHQRRIRARAMKRALV